MATIGENLPRISNKTLEQTAPAKQAETAKAPSETSLPVDVMTAAQGVVGDAKATAAAFVETLQGVGAGDPLTRTAEDYARSPIGNLHITSELRRGDNGMFAWSRVEDQGGAVMYKSAGPLHEETLRISGQDITLKVANEGPGPHGRDFSHTITLENAPATPREILEAIKTLRDMTAPGAVVAEDFANSNEATITHLLNEENPTSPFPWQPTRDTRNNPVWRSAGPGHEHTVTFNGQHITLTRQDDLYGTTTKTVVAKTNPMNLGDLQKLFLELGVTSALG
jgi:hypothetical protein